MNDLMVYGIGFTAQIFFATRLIIQWIKSEQAAKVLAPKIYWQISLFASWLMMAYGMLREDPVIILGQFIPYFIYIRNLQLSKSWAPIPLLIRFTILLFPITVLLVLGFSNDQLFFFQQDFGLTMLSVGLVGQIIFSMRFLLQWYHSEQVGNTVLPINFWYASILGSCLILSYAIYRTDPVLIIGQAFGLFIYFRNTFLHLKSGHL